MEAKKTPKADVERLRTTGFLLGLVLVLAMCYVALEWNSSDSQDDVPPLDLSELMHESELVPMSNEEVMVQMPQEQTADKGEQLRIVDDVETIEPDPEVDGSHIDTDEQLLQQLQPEDDKALASLEVDPTNPLNFHIVEDLPQYPGGAVELMKWLTKNLRYPSRALQQKIQGRVVAVFYVEKDGSITGLKVTQSLSPECDREALRVLSMMPNWKPGIQHDEPCRTKVKIPVVFKL